MRVTYITCFYPIIIALRLFGVDLHRSDKTCKCIAICKSILMRILTSIHLLALTILWTNILYLMYDRNDIDDLLMILMFLMFLVMAFQNTLGRILVSQIVTDFTRMMNKTDEIFKQFHGKEKSFLRKFQIAVFFVSTYPICCAMQQLANLLDVERKSGAKWRHKKTIDVILITIVYFMTLPYANLWIGAIDALVITQLFAVYNLLRLLEKFCHSDKGENNFQKVSKFVSMHGQICKLVELCNRVLGKIMLLWTILQITVTLFYSVAINRYMASSTLIISLTVFIMSVEIITASMVNCLIRRSLRQCRNLVNNKFPSKMAPKIAVKLDLYSVYVEVSKPYLTFGGFTKLNTTAIISVFHFLLTYAMFLYDLQEKARNPADATLK
ncbi:hypothetical protein CHUAL_009873 [Chamberlinius hualienensis]